MKKILFYAAALFAAVSCAEVGIEEITPTTDFSNGVEVSIVVSANSSIDSRVSIDDAWAVTWDEGDALTAWSSYDSSWSKFDMTTYDAENATFTGVVVGDYRLVYPYLASPTVDGSIYTVNIGAQEAGANLTYLVSEDILTVDDSSSASMVHVGAAAELTTSFKNLSGSYTLTSVLVYDVPTTLSIDLSEPFSSEDFYGESANGVIAIDVDDLAVTSSSTLRFNILPFEVAAGESIALKYYFVDEEGAPYYATSEIVNTSDSTVSFERATYNTLYASCDMSDLVYNATTTTLAEISADAIPEVDTWIITDSSVSAGSDFAGFSAAIVALKDSGRKISVEFPNMTSFPDYAVGGGSSKTSGLDALVSIKADVAESTGTQSFAYCYGLETFYGPKILTIGNSCWRNCASLTDIDLTSATYAQNLFLAGCASLESIYMPNVTYIGNYSFGTFYGAYGCTSLKSVDMPKLQTVCYRAFEYCSALTDVNMPAAVTYGDFVFEDCTSLETITLASTITSFGGSIFNGCDNLKTIECAGSNLIFEDGVLYDSNKTTCYLSVQNMMNGAIEIPSSVTYINAYAFYKCDNITSFTALGAKSSGWSILRQCTSLTEVNMPSLASLAYWTFAYCTALEEIELPSAVTFLDDTFYECTALKSVGLATNDDAQITSLGGSKMFYNVDTAAIDFTVGYSNASYVSGNTITVGSYSYTFKSITVLEAGSQDDSEYWQIVTAADGSTTGVWTDDLFATLFDDAFVNSKEVEVYESLINPGYYRIKNIFTAEYTMNFWENGGDGEEPNALDPDVRTVYTYINATNPDQVWIEYHDTGYVTDNYGAYWIGSYVPDYFTYGSTDNYGTLKDGYISFPEDGIFALLMGYSETSGFLIGGGETSLLLPGGTDPNAEPGEDPEEPTSDEFTADITVSDITTNSATISWTVTDQDQDYIYGLFTSEGLDSYSDADLMSAIVYTYNSSGILSSRTYSGDAYGNFTGLSASTAYSMFIFTIDSDENPSSPLSRADFTTAEESADGSDAYNAWLGTWNLTSTSLTDSGTSLTLQITISQDVANSSYSIYGFDLTTGRNSYAMPATYNSSTGGWSVTGYNEVGTYSSYTMMYCGYAYLGGSYNSYYIITGDYDALTATISSDGSTGAVACGSSTITDGTAFTVATVKLFAYLSGTYYSFSNDTTNLAISSSDNLVGPFTLSKVSSSSAPAAAPAATQTTTGLNMMSDMIFNAMTAKVDSSLKSVGSVELSKAPVQTGAFASLKTVSAQAK